jgi:putative transposase
MEIGTWRILALRCHRSSVIRMDCSAASGDSSDAHSHRFVIHDRDCIFSHQLNLALEHFGERVLKTPVEAPKAKAFCERLVGTTRRECLDYLIPINERHLRLMLNEFVRYYNRGRPRSALGPGTPGERPGQQQWHGLPAGCRIKSTSVLGGLHHEYRLEKEAAWRLMELLRTKAMLSRLFGTLDATRTHVNRIVLGEGLRMSWLGLVIGALIGTDKRFRCEPDPGPPHVEHL